MANLKRMGRWSSDKFVEGYLANSKTLKESRIHTIHKGINTHEVKEQASDEESMLTVKSDNDKDNNYVQTN